eukprot:6030845-Pyramimonas_sp.AAC.1
MISPSPKKNTTTHDKKKGVGILRARNHSRHQGLVGFPTAPLFECAATYGAGSATAIRASSPSRTFFSRQIDKDATQWHGTEW